ncbi:flagellar export chaperone FliS [Oceanobacillus jeddahense]|uniref:Flagellar secretion chaperone FliS n=1 Tax=Oceanobacillus jeddahense TaxID=1462527 RepID=A0ABY5JPD2_9BACI|nr:flagellar export chaperone FliS [Oceanobacillus jeddahense]UUI02147.1 flagellar export chaperone FliS [Oceanobacillus jeddahense]
MSSNKAYQTYQNNAVNTASGGELTLMLYNGCIKFIKQAMKEIENKDFAAKNTNIQKAQKIINELMVTLDMKMDISHQMMPLYDYMHNLLTEANIKNDTEKLEEALGYAEEFRDVWKQVILKDRQQKYSQGATI